MYASLIPEQAKQIRRLFDELVELAPEVRSERLAAIDDEAVRRPGGAPRWGHGRARRAGEPT